MRQVELVPLRVSGDIHGVNLLAHRNECALGIRSRHTDQFRRTRIGERPKQDAADETKDSGVCPDSERKRKRCYSSKPNTLAQLTQPEPNIQNKTGHFLPFFIYSYRSATM